MPRAAVDDLFRDEPLIAGGFRDYEAIPGTSTTCLGIGGFDVPTITAMVAFDESQGTEATRP